jgi:hypothetical protein
MVASRPSQASLDDLALVLAAVLIGCAILYLATALVVRGPLRSRVPSLTVFFAVLWFYCYAKLATHLGRHLGGHPHIILVPLGLALTLVTARVLMARPGWLDRMAAFLSLTGGLLTVVNGARILYGSWQSHEELRHSAVVRALAAPIPIREGFEPQPKRDIYLIVLDEYANADDTREQFGFDNRVFEDSLRRIGFYIPPVMRSNYLHTTLSIPSLLNAALLSGLEGELGPHTSDPTVPNYLVENNRAVMFLKGQGYRFVFFPSEWWLSTRHNRHADVEFQAWPTLSSRELSHTELRRSFRKITILNLFHTDEPADAEHITRTFAALRRVPGLDRGVPTLAFAHILKPHRPYTFDQECRPRRHTSRRETPPRGQGYIRQLNCINQMTLELIDTVLRTSKIPPIILLQGDHGTKTLGAPNMRSVNAITPAAARERFGAFGAYYLPAGGASVFGDTVTVVNVLGNVLRYYLGADLRPEPNDLDMSVGRALYAVRRIDPAWLSRSSASNTRSRNRVQPDLKPPAPPNLQQPSRMSHPSSVLDHLPTIRGSRRS